MRVLVACEFSGIVRRAFRDRGHDAWSCDLLPAEDGSAYHYQCDVRDILHEMWDLLIAHPPCTRLANSGVRWLHTPPLGRTREEMWRELEEGAALFSALWNANHITRRCIENPVMHRHAKRLISGYVEPAQTVQPWQFGDAQSKRTCLWLHNLQPLRHTKVLMPPPSGSAERRRWERVHRMPPSPDRSKERSRFFPGIAAAMAEQWM